MKKMVNFITDFLFFDSEYCRDMLQSTDAFPLNFGFTGKGNSTRTDGIALGLEEQIKAGAIG